MCVRFEAEEKVMIDGIKPGHAQLFAYYNPGKHTHTHTHANTHTHTHTRIHTHTHTSK